MPEEDQDEFVRLGRRLALAYAPYGVLEEEGIDIDIFKTEQDLEKVRTPVADPHDADTNLTRICTRQVCPGRRSRSH